MKHRLAAVGDSLMQGFIDGALHETNHSIPAVIASALGIKDKFLQPAINPAFDKVGGIPLNYENVLRMLSRGTARCGLGRHLHWYNLPVAAFLLHRRFGALKRLWRTESLTAKDAAPACYHNLGTISFTTADVNAITSRFCAEAVAHPSLKGFHFIKELLEWPVYRVAGHILNPTGNPRLADRTILDCLESLSQDGGIENCLLFLGLNDAIGPLLAMSMAATDPDAVTPHVLDRNANVLVPPPRFEKNWLALSQRIHRMNIERVFVITVPHITVLPIIRGVGTRSGKYYPYYTRPWIWDSDFDPARHSHLTQGDIERIDGIIDEYNAVIRRSADGYGWHIVDFCGFMDESAFGRNNGTTRVPWPPEAIAALRDNKATGYLVDADGNVHLDIRYFRGAIDKNGSFRITTGGLIGLDGMHPTVLFYALMAHHVLQVMITTGVRAEGGNIPRVDWASAISSDTLLMDPPVLLADLKRAAKLMAGSFFNTMEKLCFTPNQLSTPAHKPS